MKQNDFYEVDGCMDFIPVTIGKVYDDAVGVTVSNAKRNCTLVVEEVYRFPKVQEPQKVVVPAFIDRFIGYAKAEGMSLFIAMDNAQNKESEWIITHEDTFARAWLDGDEIEQKKLYTVEIAEAILTKIIRGHNVQYKMLPIRDVSDVFDNAIYYINRLTEKEIKEADERLWEFAKPVEEEER